MLILFNILFIKFNSIKISVLYVNKGINFIFFNILKSVILLLNHYNFL